MNEGINTPAIRKYKCNQRITNSAVNSTMEPSENFISEPVRSTDSKHRKYSVNQQSGSDVIPESKTTSDSVSITSTDTKSSWKNYINFIRRWLVVPVCLLYFGAYITSFLTLQQYVYRKLQREKYPNTTFNSSIPICNANESDPNYKIQTEVQQESAEWMTYFAIAAGTPAVFSDLILGSYTDRFGRKFLFFLPCIGGFIRLAITAVGIYTDFGLYWYIPGFIIEGLSGYMFGLLLVSFSYIADITPPGKLRSFGIVIVELAIGMGMAGFSFGAGYFIQASGFLWPMFSSAVFTAVSIVFVILLPETYTKDKRKQASSAWENLHNAYKLFFGKSNAGKRWMLNILMLAFLFTMFTILGRSNVDTLYQLNNPFCWDPEHVSWFVALRSGSQQVVGMGLVKPFQFLFSDEVIALFGCVSFMAGFVLEGLAKSNVMIYLGKSNVIFPSTPLPVPVFKYHMN